ncbi:hypothetical protein T4B_938 [Trichinella pseudospiralis]|uniref:Uncharacterized protein n=1 Tax=Trichinella pseudospiralis TaxID=6337 RepID=A0A0V1JEZ6_TRIPS|nr:hypothetical protein T4B_938 [Trichinella pseudospiralis]KRY97333.1 hypothetical protein T4C_11447 [Trichinella pseudospiralis]KRZ33546.1 hypothetical protein T4C_13300 [Trichinella pseudospiralis]
MNISRGLLGMPTLDGIYSTTTELFPVEFSKT